MKTSTSRHYRLGIDVGSNSLGWFVIWLDDKGEPVGLGPGGARIYSDGRDPKSKESNAADRRLARGMRRRRDRYLQRRGKLMSLLVKHGLMPTEESARKALEGLDPYELRAQALDAALPAHHLGRALFHLNQRRGFLSNRKTEKGDSESGLIKQGAAKLAALKQEAGARTLGEWLAMRHRARETVRTRNSGTATKVAYDFYPTRALLREEFDAMWKAQVPHHPSMTQAARAEIEDAIFFQRSLKPVPVGKCSLDPASSKDDAEGFRCSWAHPLAQRFRIWQEVRNLAVVEAGKASAPLTKENGDKIALALLQNNKLTFDKMRALLKLPQEAKFNLESEKREHLKGDETAEKLSAKKYFAKDWRGFSLDHQIEIVTQLEDESDEKVLIDWLMANAGLNADIADSVANATLPDGHCRLGLRAIRKILPYMADQGLNYPDAARAAGYDHAVAPTGEIRDYLPYYGEWLQDDVLGDGDERNTLDKRWGRFPNPTVHIGLGQIRRVVNALIREYGPPDEIALEMTRDFKLSPTKLSEVEQEQAENQKKNERRAEQIRKLGQTVNAQSLMKIRLWEEQNVYDPLDRRCPYSGEVISIERLLSDETEIDHLIPFSDSWDDGAANKVVCMRSANRYKKNRTPYEAFGASTGKPYDWAEISQRAALLPKSKRWRFDPDARTRFDKSGGFQARQLMETGWLARVALHYLAAVTNPYKIHVLPGKLTAMIRGKWGLNSLLPDHNFSDAKNRKDHRHHAIDALVAACTDRSLLHRMSSAYDEERRRIEIPLPWPTLRDDLDAKLKAMTVSHKPDHGTTRQGNRDNTTGALHEDTAYGLVKNPEKEDGANLVYRKSFLGLNDKEITRIRDRRLRDLLAAHVEAEKSVGKDLKAALLSFTERKDMPGIQQPIRHVRLTKSEKPEYLVTIKDKDGGSYKAYSAGENAFVDILEASGPKWVARAVTVFQANQELATTADLPDGARFVMRVFKNDMLRIEHEGKVKIVRVVRLAPSSNTLYLVEHNEAGTLQKRHDDENDPFRWIFANFDKLREWNAVPIRVDEIGRLWRINPGKG